MAVNEKLYERIKNNPKNVSFEDIDKLLITAGFKKRNGGRKSHWIYKHENLKDVRDFVTIPRERPVKSVYIKKALRLFEQVYF